MTFCIMGTLPSVFFFNSIYLEGEILDGMGRHDQGVLDVDTFKGEWTVTNSYYYTCSHHFSSLSKYQTYSIIWWDGWSRVGQGGVGHSGGRGRNLMYHSLISSCPTIHRKELLTNWWSYVLSYHLPAQLSSLLIPLSLPPPLPQR